MINIAPAKSCELDPIPTTLHENRDILLPTITNIINTSLTTGIVTRDLKTAIVKPLLKIYRPISNLPSLKMQPRLLLLPLSSHGSTTATVSSWVHLILSFNLSKKFRTLLKDLFSRHPVTTTQHLSWKNCTGFLFQNVLNIKSLVTFLNCYMSTLRLVRYVLLLTPACKNPAIQRKTHGFRAFSCF